MIRRRAAQFDLPPGAVELADVGADLVGLAAMLRGSVRYRSPLL